MKNYERLLLSHLQEDNSKNSNDPLSDVKKSMGQIAFVKGNPLTKTEITISIRMYYLDAALNLIPPAGLGVGYRISFPIYLFGLTDYYGGLKCFNTINPINPTWRFQAPVDPIYMGIWGVTMFRTGTGVVLDGFPERGDLVYFIRPNFPGATLYTCMVIIHCNNVAYGTFLNSFVSDLITINTLRLIIPIANINQFMNPLIFGYQTLFGKLFTDTVDPRNYITSTDFQQQICDIPINLPIDKAVMLGFQNDWYNDFMQMILFVEKVESLTHKSNLSKKK